VNQDIKRNAALVIACGAAMVIISMGTRQSFGLFLQPITLDLAVGREVFSLAIAFQNLLFGLPLVGVLADRFGSRGVAMGGGLLYAASFLLLSVTNSPAGLYLNLGMVVGIALSSTSYVVVLGAAAQVVPEKKRSSTFGLITAAGSFGMFAVVPVIQWLIEVTGWQTAFAILSAFVSLIAVLAIGFPGRIKNSTPQLQENNPNETRSLAEVLKQARGHSGYLLLTAGFFVCGFHVAFIATHLPAFLADQSIAKMSDRLRKKYLLSLLYLSRAIVITLFLVFPISNPSAVIFGCAIGFLWLATVPLTSGIVAAIFGPRYLSTLYGIVFFSHQIGSFLGVWLGGRIYDIAGSYTMVWIMAILLGVIASILHLPISDQPLHFAKSAVISAVKD
jgi:predicted MFS family arabinose efflux permease